jgi:ubiquinone/menaquinone biosynthesis C-methylase UbiE
MNKEKVIEQDWDVYWAGKKKHSNAAYDFLAGSYRKLILKNILAHFVTKHFTKGCSMLHAGCGSGQVDVDIAKDYNITALDISENALKIYRSVHGENAKTVKASIFNIPFPNETFDGVYSLGVVEHFTEDEIQQILSEFKRVLKPGGKVLTLWPPTFGFTVFILDSAHFILNRILRLKVKLHPDEITRLRSRQHAYSTFQKAGFEVLDYYFGPRDIFTQAAIIVRKS